MKKNFLRAKLAQIISNLNEIILCEGEQAYSIQALKKCRDDLEQLLSSRDSNVAIDLDAMLYKAHSLIECLLFWLSGK